LSSLNVSGTTTLNNATTSLSSLNVVGNIIGSGTALTNLNCNAITNKPDFISASYLNNSLTSGSLTIGGTTFDYGNATGWSTNTAGLMMECNNYTEICVHDASTRVASLMHYDGVSNKIFSGGNQTFFSAGFQRVNFDSSGNISCGGISCGLNVEELVVEQLLKEILLFILVNCMHQLEKK
jgi:hypothetical protein